MSFPIGPHGQLTPPGSRKSTVDCNGNPLSPPPSQIRSPLPKSMVLHRSDHQFVESPKLSSTPLYPEQSKSPIPHPQQIRTTGTYSSQGVGSADEYYNRPHGRFPQAHQSYHLLGQERYMPRYGIAPPYDMQQRGVPPHSFHDSGYGSGDYGQHSNFPVPPAQNTAAPPGNKFGKITATGQSRLLFGSVFDDPSHRNINGRNNTYGDIDVHEKASAAFEDMSSEAMVKFMDRSKD